MMMMMMMMMMMITITITTTTFIFTFNFNIFKSICIFRFPRFFGKPFFWGGATLRAAADVGQGCGVRSRSPRGRLLIADCRLPIAIGPIWVPFLGSWNLVEVEGK